MSDPRSQTGKHLAEVIYAVLTEREVRLEGLKVRLARLAKRPAAAVPLDPALLEDLLMRVRAAPDGTEDVIATLEKAWGLS